MVLFSLFSFRLRYANQIKSNQIMGGRGCGCGCGQDVGTYSNNKGRAGIGPIGLVPQLSNDQTNGNCQARALFLSIGSIASRSHPSPASHWTPRVNESLKPLAPREARRSQDANVPTQLPEPVQLVTANLPRTFTNPHFDPISRESISVGHTRG